MANNLTKVPASQKLTRFVMGYSMVVMNAILSAGVALYIVNNTIYPAIQSVRYKARLERLYQAASAHDITIADPRDGAEITVRANDSSEPKTLRVEWYDPIQRALYSINPDSPYNPTTVFVDRGADGLGLEDKVCDRERLPEETITDICFPLREVEPSWQEAYQRAYRDATEQIEGILKAGIPSNAPKTKPAQPTVPGKEI